MRIPSANKAAATSGRCHHCRRSVGWPECRQELYGWYCVQRGLQLGEGVELVVPDPPAAPWEQAPEVLAAAEAESGAQAEYEAADSAWRAAYQRLTQRPARPSVWTFSRGGFIPRKAEPQDQTLVDAEAAARARRDEAGETLRAARVAYAATLRRAEWEHRATRRAA